MKIPKASPNSVELLKSLLPHDERVRTRPLFGNLAAFVNGNLFLGLFGDGIFARVSPDDMKGLLKIDGTSLFSPRKGRPMRGYVAFSKAWHKDQGKIKPWVSKSLGYTLTLPVKNSRKEKRKLKP